LGFRGGGLQMNEALFQQRLDLIARTLQDGREKDVEPLPAKERTSSSPIVTILNKVFIVSTFAI